eukprot:GILJ01013754.1.p1 GENE.GILJ01013754.1~~GILJ01013754.1.p1  ORF type:complete len:649 (+),score=100.39 GILJ01013754.1:54-2000(+)
MKYLDGHNHTVAQLKRRLSKTTLSDSTTTTSPQHKKPRNGKENNSQGHRDIFSGCYIYVHPTGIVRTQWNILRQRLSSHGGILEDEFPLQPLQKTFVVTVLDLNELRKDLSLKQLPKLVAPVDISWATESLRTRSLQPCYRYRLDSVINNNNNKSGSPNHTTSSPSASAAGLTDSRPLDPIDTSQWLSYPIRRNSKLLVNGPKSFLKRKQVPQTTTTFPSSHTNNTAAAETTDTHTAQTHSEQRVEPKTPVREKKVVDLSHLYPPDKTYDSEDEERAAKGAAKLMQAATAGAHAPHTEGEGGKESKSAEEYNGRIKNELGESNQVRVKMEPTMDSNKRVVDVLRQAQAHDPTRTLDYSKAVDLISSMTQPLTVAKVSKGIDGLNSEISQKILSILESNYESVTDEKTLVINRFTKIWGVNRQLAESWYHQGIRFMHDLLTHPGLLNVQQSIGLKYYDDFISLIPRAEVDVIAQRIRAALDLIDPSVHAQLCGSYRRGKSAVNQAHILLQHAKGGEAGVLEKLIHNLKGSGLIMDDVSTNHKDKYLGVCRYNRSHPHRRIDIRLFDKRQFPYALLYYTGSDKFIASLQLAANQLGLSLTSTGLHRVSTAEQGLDPLIPCLTEEEIFGQLQLKYIIPTQRESAHPQVRLR